MIDKNLKKVDLKKMANISSSTISKLTKGENLNTDVLLKICIALNCDISEIMEIVEYEN